MQTTANVPRPGGSVWTDPKARAWLFQILAVIAVVALGWFLFDNTQTNLEKRGITSGFSFLNNSAGFGIAQHLIDYDESNSYGRVFVVGLLNTLLVSVIGIVLATLLGFLLGVARLSPNWLVSKLATVYIETFRNIPPLLQIFFWYFAVMLSLPGPRQSMGIGETFFLNSRGLYMPAPSPTDSFGTFFAALVIALIGVVLLVRWSRARFEATGKYFPVSLGAVPLLLIVPGLAILLTGNPLQWSTPELTGFNFRGGWVLIPELMALTQALRVIIPPLTSQYLNLAKNSSLAAGIGYPDMVSLFAGTVLNQTGQAIEVIAITMSVYLAISISISMLMNWYNKRMALIER